MRLSLFMMPVHPPSQSLSMTLKEETEKSVLAGYDELDRLVALRERVGPFGTLLQIGLDWSGPNEAWEREGMRLLTQEVMPRFRQHVTAQAAE